MPRAPANVFPWAGAHMTRVFQRDTKIFQARTASATGGKNAAPMNAILTHASDVTF
jgi:hypothetical protein